MMSTLAIGGIWLGVTVFEALDWVYLWQAKEYRLDRLKAHWHTRLGKRELLSFHWLTKVAFLAVAFAWPRLFQSVGISALALIFLSQLAIYLWRIRAKLLRKPRWTAKAGLIFILAAIIQAVFVSQYFSRLGWTSFLMASVFLPVSVVLAVAILMMPSRFAKQRIVRRAAAIIHSQPNLRTIGVTGSFGKTSTKEFITAFLKTSHSVVSTKDRENTLIGLAGRINRSLRGKPAFFVVEMGAYQPGEITKMCALVRPNVGVVTVLAPQHLGLFGTFDRLVQAKMELIEAAAEGGRVVVNGDDCRLIKEVEIKNVVKHIFALKNQQADFLAEKVLMSPDMIRFTVREKKKRYIIQAPLLGKQNVPNLLAAIAVARLEGVSIRNIKAAAQTLRPLGGTMKRVKTKKGPTVVDDTYNANPEGVLAAVEYLTAYSGQRWLVFQPMIELGEVAVGEHRRVLQKALSVCDGVIMTNQNYWPGLKKFFSSAEWERIHLARNRGQFDRIIAGKFHQGDILLFEGKEAHKYLEHFVHHVV